MSWRRWLGWEPTEVTTYEYETIAGPDGPRARLVRSVTVRETEWDDESRDLAEALVHLEGDACPGCGHPLSESLESNFPPGTESIEVYKPDAHRCMACNSISILQQHKAAKGYLPQALLFTARRLDR